MTVSTSASAARVDLDALADLEEQRRFLLQSLKDLEREREAGDIDDDDYRTLKDDYTARAAAVLHAIDESRTGIVRQRRTRRRRSAKTTAMIVAGVAVVAIVAGVLVASSSGQRLPGATASGNTQQQQSDINGDLNQAQQLFTQGKAVDALKLYDKVLKQEPNNAIALTFRGWVLEAAGLHDDAMASLDKAEAADPTFAMAHFFRGMVLFQGKGQPAAAIPEFEAFLATKPPADAVTTAQQVLDQAKKAAGQK